jgi:hypothetical protein
LAFFGREPIRVNEKRYSQAFAEAASQLGFQFTSPFECGLASGAQVRAMGLVHEFGAPRGILLFLESMTPPNPSELKASGLGYSMLGSSYERYDEALFKATLNDWQYFGSFESRPCWYTGESW